MNCPICSSDAVVLRKDGAERRKRCTKCGHRFVTVEKLKEDEARQAAAIEAVRAAARKLEPTEA